MDSKDRLIVPKYISTDSLKEDIRGVLLQMP